MPARNPTAGKSYLRSSAKDGLSCKKKTLIFGANSKTLFFHLYIQLQWRIIIALQECWFQFKLSSSIIFSNRKWVLSRSKVMYTGTSELGLLVYFFWGSSLLSNQLLYNQINECMTSRSSSTLSISTVFPFFIPRFAFVELSLSWHWVHSLSCMALIASKVSRKLTWSENKLMLFQHTETLKLLYSIKVLKTSKDLTHLCTFWSNF